MATIKDVYSSVRDADTLRPGYRRKDDVVPPLVIDQEQIEECINNFFTDYFEKPVSPADIGKIPINVFEASLIDACRKLFPRGSFKKSKTGEELPAGIYRWDAVEKILDIYLFICNKYNKVPSVIGFSFLSGIDYSYLYDLCERLELRPEMAEVVKRINLLRENSISNRLIDGKSNPIGAISVLNHQFGWNMPGVRQVETKPRANMADIANTLGLPETIAPQGAEHED